MWHVFLCTCTILCLCYASPRCGGLLRTSHGIIHTPGFPRPFHVPIHCRWVIDNSASHNESILVFLTQVYVTTGLTFTEFVHYESDSPQYQLGKRVIHEVTERNVTTVHWLRTTRPYLVVDFKLDRLEGNHLRSLDNFLHVFGFNITYEISSRTLNESSEVCSVLECSFSGHCYANANFKQYSCSCFEGYSGMDCGKGPLCDVTDHVCSNEQICRQFGSKVAYCKPGCLEEDCLQRITVNYTKECENTTCIKQCPVSRNAVPCACNVYTKLIPDKVKYKGTVKLTNITSTKDLMKKNLFEKQIKKYLQDNQLATEEVRVLNITSSGEITFHFLGSKKDGNRFRELLNRLVERGRLGSFTLLSTHMSLKQEPSLLLKNVQINQVKAVVREGDEFILSCIAQGSPQMTFQWFKDNVLINTTKAIRNMWVELLPLDSHDQYTAIIGNERASFLDEGEYTCQVIDSDIQQCKSIYIQIARPPKVTLIPGSITVDKGKNISIVCMAQNDEQNEKFGYNWTKNKALLPMVPGKEVWEDLYPIGSILNIYNIQKSAMYTCRVHGMFFSEARNVRVEVVNRSLVPLCTKEKAEGLTWPDTAANTQAIVHCPRPYTGHASRACAVSDSLLTKWQLPNFSECVHPKLKYVYSKFLSLTLGFQNTTVTDTLTECLKYLQDTKFLYPGEGKSVLNLLADVLTYTKLLKDDNVLSSTVIFFEIVSVLLERKYSIISEKNVIELQRLSNTEAMLWASLITGKNSHADFNSIIVEVVSLKNALKYELHFPLQTITYPTWFYENISVDIRSKKDEYVENEVILLTVVIYKNLTEFLPNRNVMKLANGEELEYEVISRVVAIDMSHQTQHVNSTVYSFSVDIEFYLLDNVYDMSLWEPRCAVAPTVTASFPWNINSCHTMPVTANVTRCRCNRPGSYAVLLTMKFLQADAMRTEQEDYAVLAGCVCCLVQTTIAVLLLIPYYIQHRSCLVYLKLQCCIVTSGAMAIFIYSVQHSLSKNSFPYITTSLEALLLIGMSSHLSKILIVYTELVPIPRMTHRKLTIVTVITGLPVLTVLCSQLAHDSTSWKLSSWWITCGSMLFNIFITSAVVMLLLFIFLYLTVMSKLRFLMEKNMASNESLEKRAGLLKRGATIFSTMIFMESSSICYINMNGPSFHYLFGFSSAVLGTSIFLCYVVKSETPVYSHILHRFNKSSKFQSPESANSPLHLFTRQEAEVESEGPAPLNNINQKDEDSAEEEFFPRRFAENASSTVETYVENVEERENCSNAEQVLLESYPSSPKKYSKDKDSNSDNIKWTFDNVTAVTKEKLECTDTGKDYTPMLCKTEELPEIPNVPKKPEVPNIPNKPEVPNILKKPESDKRTIEGKTTTDILDSISHDLDYLLNRSRSFTMTRIDEEQEEELSRVTSPLPEK